MQKVPTDLQKALAGNAKARAQWKTLTPISQRDFISWIEGAKQKETRARRITVAESKLVSGKRRPCCYAVVPMDLYTALGKIPKAKATWKELTPDERRDFVDWIDKAKGPDEKKVRIAKTSTILASGKRHL